MCGFLKILSISYLVLLLELGTNLKNRGRGITHQSGKEKPFLSLKKLHTQTSYAGVVYIGKRIVQNDLSWKNPKKQFFFGKSPRKSKRVENAFL